MLTIRAIDITADRRRRPGEAAPPAPPGGLNGEPDARGAGPPTLPADSRCGGNSQLLRQPRRRRRRARGNAWSSSRRTAGGRGRSSTPAISPRVRSVATAEDDRAPRCSGRVASSSGRCLVRVVRPGAEPVPAPSAGRSRAGRLSGRSAAAAQGSESARTTSGRPPQPSPRPRARPGAIAERRAPPQQVRQFHGTSSSSGQRGSGPHPAQGAHRTDSRRGRGQAYGRPSAVQRAAETTARAASCTSARWSGPRKDSA